MPTPSWQQRLRDAIGGLDVLGVAGALVVVCVVLYRSMRVQLRNIDVDRFNQPDPMSGPASEPPDAGPDQRPTRGSAGSEPT